MSHPELFFLSRKFLFEFISSVLDFHSWFVASCRSRSQPGSSRADKGWAVKRPRPSRQTLPLSLNYGGLICFLALLPRPFVLVRCLREANIAIFCGRFGWSRQTSLSKGFFYNLYDSTLNYIFVLLLANVDVIPKQKQQSTA